MCVQANDSFYFRIESRSALFAHNFIVTADSARNRKQIAKLSTLAYFERKCFNRDSLLVNNPYLTRIKNASLSFLGFAPSGLTGRFGFVTVEVCGLVTVANPTYDNGDPVGGWGYHEEWQCSSYTYYGYMEDTEDAGGGSGTSGTNDDWWNGYSSGSGGGSGGATGFSPLVTSLASQLGLTYDQSVWLENNTLRAIEIYNYLQCTTNQGAHIIANQHIDKMMSDFDYLSFNQQHYSNSSSSNVWWEDDYWLDNPNYFNLDLDQGPNNDYEKLTAAEKALVKKYPTHAYTISRNKDLAIQETLAIFGSSGRNDKSDAFRHAFFNAINRRDLGLDPLTLENIAKLFSDAHESETPPQLEKEKEMDLWNNAVGHIVGSVMFPIFTSNSSLSTVVLDKLAIGELKYLKPVLTHSQDPNFWGTNGAINPLTATHGITSFTQLVSTNQ